jgi:hypothetical protein
VAVGYCHSILAVLRIKYILCSPCAAVIFLGDGILVSLFVVSNQTRYTVVCFDATISTATIQKEAPIKANNGEVQGAQLLSIGVY